MKTYLPLLFLLLRYLSSACSCSRIATFCETVSADASGQSFVDLVVRGRKIQNVSGGMTFEIEDILQGDEDAKNIHISNLNSFCGMDIGIFNVGDELVLALIQLDDDMSEDYVVPVCANPFLRVNGDVVTGDIATGISSLNYVELKNISGCNKLSPRKFEKLLKVYPNPTSGPLKLRLEGEANLQLQYKIYNVLGQLMWASEELTLKPFVEEAIDLERLVSGVYLVELLADSRKVVYRILVE